MPALTAQQLQWKKKNTAQAQKLFCAKFWQLWQELGYPCTTFNLKYSWITATATIHTVAVAAASPDHAQRTASEVTSLQDLVKERKKRQREKLRMPWVSHAL